MNPDSENGITQKAVENLTAGGNITIGNITQNINNSSNLPKPIGSPQNLPRSGVIKFVGREQTLENLHQQLQQTERVAISAVTGMGGIGKTELALQYADNHWKQGTYSGGVCWFRVRDEDIGIQIVNFAREIGLQPPDNFDLLNKIKYCWRNWQAGDVLVVFDDVREYQQIKHYLPPNDPRFKVLVTTRQQWLGQSFRRLILEVLGEEPALKLLKSFVGEERIDQEEEEAKKLCADLGYLPLGLELVARYLQRKRNLSLLEMRQRLALEHRSLKETSGDMTAQLGVAAAFELSWRELNPEARELACLLSIFALAPIPWGLVEQCLPEEDKEYLEDIRDDFLVDFSLLEDKGENTYQLHQLIREFLIGKQEELPYVEDMKRGFCAVMAGAARNITETPTQLEIIEITPVIPHLIETASNLTNYLNYFDVIVPFARLGMLYKAKADYEQALQWCEQCLTICRKRFKEEHEEVATSLNNLAFLYCSQGRYQEAEPLYLQALQIRKKILGKEHLDLAISLNNLALFYRSQGLYEQAEPLCLQALQMRKRLLREEHPCIASSLDNLALIYRSQGRYKKAKPLYLQALQMRKRLLGESHPDVATSLNNLALLYCSQERYKRAEYLFLQALQMKKKLLGEEHLNIVAGLNNLALLYCSQERYPEAEPLFLQALQMVKKLLGESHPDVATSLNNLAFLYRSQKRYQEAEPLYNQSLSIAEKILGVNHPNTNAIRENLHYLRNVRNS